MLANDKQRCVVLLREKGERLKALRFERVDRVFLGEVDGIGCFESVLEGGDSAEVILALYILLDVSCTHQILHHGLDLFANLTSSHKDGLLLILNRFCLGGFEVSF